MIGIVPISFFSLYSDYLNNWGEQRLCRSTLEYIKLTNSKYSIGYSYHDKIGPISISIASRTFPYAVIATRPNSRGQGFGKKVLQRTVNHFGLEGLKYSTWVASDNESSICLLESVGLKRVKREVKDRSSGEYIAYLYSNRN